MAEVDGGASVLGNNPLAWLHPRPREEKFPWRGVERRQQGKRARKRESKKEQVKSPSTRCCPGGAPEDPEKSSGGCPDKLSGWRIAGNPALSAGNVWRRQLRRASKVSRRPRIIAMTANVFQEDKNKCLEAGMDDFIGKPFLREALIESLEKCRLPLAN